jgi:hypothetical protein
VRSECTHGVFVGVTRTPQTEDLPELKHAAEDAARLSDYFRSARPGGDWRTLGPPNACEPSRSTIFERLHWLAKEVPEGQAGLFYFSGHGLRSDRGLVLAPSDFRATFPEDSGICLRRIVEIFKIAGQGRRFLLVLDCCRKEAVNTFEDDVPPNVCILYACTPGGVAYESKSGGVFTRSLQGCLEAFAAASGRKTFCSVRDVSKRLSRYVFGWRSLTYELLGGWSDQIALPAVPSTDSESNSSDEGASCTLEYRLSLPQEFEALKAAIEREILRWFNLRDGSPSGKALLAETVTHDREELILRLHLPNGGIHWWTGELLEGILLLDCIDPKIIFKWPTPVRESAFKTLAPQLGGKWEQRPDFSGPGGLEITWKNKLESVEYEGHAVTTTDSQGNSVAFLYCTVGGHAASIRMLLPSLVAVHDRIRYLRTS